MKIVKYILFVISTITLMTSCKEELDEFPLSDITITAQWAGDHPIYNVEYTNCTLEDVKEIGIKEKFIDNQWGKKWDNERVIKLSTSNLTADDKYWTAYPGDAFETFAYIICKNGRFRSDVVSTTVPKIKAYVNSVELIPDLNNGNEAGFDIKLKGEGFSATAKYELTSQKAHHKSTLPNEVYFYYYTPKNYGIIKDTLLMNNEKIPFQFEYEGPKIKNISSNSIEIGGLINIEFNNTNYDFDIPNALFMPYKPYMVSDPYDRLINKVTIFPLVDTEGDFEIKLYDKLLNVYNDSRKIHINKNKWTKVLKQKCGRGYLHDNRLYQFDKGSITVYDCNSGKKLKSYSWTGSANDIRHICFNDNNLYYCYNDNNTGFDVIEKMDLNTSKVETFAKLQTYNYVREIWSDGKNIKTRLEDNTIYVIKNGVLTEDTQAIEWYESALGYDNGYIYFIAHPEYTDILCRIKDGNSSDLKEMGVYEKFDFETNNRDSPSLLENGPLRIIGDWLYSLVRFEDKYDVIYKTRISTLGSSKEEHISLGNLHSFINGKELKAHEISTDGENYYFKCITADGYITIAKRPVE